MTTVTSAPAQAARAGATSGAPASPRRPIAPTKRCSGHNRAGAPCGNARGFGTDHPGTGNCKYHLGSTLNGRKAAARERAEITLASLAIPADGDPLEVLQAAVESAYGVLLASRELVTLQGTDASLKLYLDGIERAARVAKSAAEAVNLDELVKIREREADLLEGALMRALERSGMPAAKRPAFLGLFREELHAVLPAAEELS